VAILKDPELYQSVTTQLDTKNKPKSTFDDDQVDDSTTSTKL